MIPSAHVQGRGWQPSRPAGRCRRAGGAADAAATEPTEPKGKNKGKGKGKGKAPPTEAEIALLRARRERERELKAAQREQRERLVAGLAELEMDELESWLDPAEWNERGAEAAGLAALLKAAPPQAE